MYIREFKKEKFHIDLYNWRPVKKNYSLTDFITQIAWNEILAKVTLIVTQLFHVYFTLNLLKKKKKKILCQELSWLWH